ncbi:MAG: hypothetical protein HY428_01755 [Candidatus Levybacteria bacterium]|nr:hypothetical protein [Candidatus Levybacteria bacterium]
MFSENDLRPHSDRDKESKIPLSPTEEGYDLDSGLPQITSLAQEHILFRHEILAYHEDAKIISGVGSELGVLLLAMLATEGSHTIPSFRESMDQLGTDASTSTLPYDRELRMTIDRLVAAGFIKKSGKIGSTQFHIVDEGEQAVLYAGYAWEIALRYPNHTMRDLWTHRFTWPKPKEVAPETTSGPKRTVGSSLQVIDGIVIGARGEVPETIASIMKRLKKEGIITNRSEIWHVIHRYKQLRLLSYGQIFEHLPDENVYVPVKEKPNTPMTPRQRLVVLSKYLMEEYIKANLGMPISPSHALRFIEQHNPELFRSDPQKLKENIGRVLSHFAKEGHFSTYTQPAIQLTNMQLALFQDIVTMMVNVEEGNPEGLRKAEKLLQDPDNVALLLEKEVRGRRGVTLGF